MCLCVCVRSFSFRCCRLIDSVGPRFVWSIVSFHYRRILDARRVWRRFFLGFFFWFVIFFVASLWLVPECGRVTGHRNIVSVYRDFLLLLFFFPISVLGAFFFNRVPQIVEEKEVEFTDFSPFFLR